jgi:hypothetical protein
MEVTELIIYLSLLISLIGLAFYAVLPPTKPKELAITFAMFWVGLLAFLINYTHIVGVVPR